MEKKQGTLFASRKQQQHQQKQLVISIILFTNIVVSYYGSFNWNPPVYNKDFASTFY